MRKKRRWPTAVTVCLLTITFTGIALLYVLRGCGVDSTVRWFITFGAMTLAGICCVLTSVAYCKKWKPHLLFLTLFGVLSLAMMFALPLSRVPDEDSHLQRIYLISTGQILPVEGQAFTEPQNLLNGLSDESASHTILGYYKQDTLSSDQVVSGAGFNTGVYLPLGYFPQAIGIALVRLFTNNRLTILYGARIGAWTVTMLLLCLSVNLLPKGKYGAIALLLTPMALQECMSASADGLAIGAVYLLSAWIVNKCHAGKKLKQKDLGVMILLCMLTAICKMIYVPFAFLPAVIPVALFGDRRRKLYQLLLCWLCTFGLIFIWLFLCYDRYISGTVLTEGMAGVGTILPQAQYVLTHFLSFLQAVWTTIRKEAASWCISMLGSSLSAFNVAMPTWLIVLDGISILIIWIEDTAHERGEFIPFRVLSLVLSFLCIMEMLFMLYCWWNPYMAASINGMQGRYFIPLLLPVLTAIRFRRNKASKLYDYLPLLLQLPALISVVCIARTVLLTW